MTDEAGCTALDEITPTNDWYDYQWNTDGCYCSINWKKPNVPDTCTERGEVINPFYKRGSAVGACITQADFEMNNSFSNCGDSGDSGSGGSGSGEETGPCEGSARGFASAFLYTSVAQFSSILTNAEVSGQERAVV